MIGGFLLSKTEIMFLKKKKKLLLEIVFIISNKVLNEVSLGLKSTFLKIFHENF